MNSEIVEFKANSLGIEPLIGHQLSLYSINLGIYLGYHISLPSPLTLKGNSEAYLVNQNGATI